MMLRRDGKGEPESQIPLVRVLISCSMKRKNKSCGITVSLDVNVKVACALFQTALGIEVNMCNHGIL